MNLSLSMLPALETQSWSILFEDFTAVSALLLLCGKYALLGWCVMSQSFIHFLKTLLIIWGSPSVVMCSGTFQVAQKSLMIVTRCWPSNLPWGVDTMAFYPVNLSAITKKLWLCREK